MHSRLAAQFWRLLAIGTTFCAIFGAVAAVMAGQVGTTPEGDVIYVFTCPANPPATANWDVNWPNHLGDHPTWKIQNENHSLPAPYVRSSFLSKVRNGQELLCKYSVSVGTQMTSSRITYRYKVHRDIISCESTSYNSWKCILKEGSGGQSSSSATATPSKPPAKCVGLGCESQPNPGACIGLGCDRPITGPQRSASGLEEP